jgi:hypothetical protein
MIKMSISSGNSKTGKIEAFSLPPVESCLNSSTCASFAGKDGKQYKCYAIRPYTQYKQTKAAWDRNLELARNNLPELEKQLVKYFKRYNGLLFRLHVSGDFVSKEYLDMWIRVIRRYPNIKFLSYTKVYGFFKGLDLPKNFSVLLSYMPSIPTEQAKNFSKVIGLPMAHATDQRPDGFITCPEQSSNKKTNCVECKLCWNLPQLKRVMNIHFIPH